MTITALPPAPSTSDPTNFATKADALLAALPTFVTEANALAAAMNLNSTTDTSATSNSIGTGSKTFTVSAGKSFQPGMYLVIADDAAPSTNSMACQVTSYSGTTLIVNVFSIRGSGTKTAWTISQSAYGTFDGQIQFPATQNASADPNTLDDYEKGTWTPSLGGSTTYTSQYGSYTKVGNLVAVTGTLQVNAIGTGSTITISGLPFSASPTTINNICPVNITASATAIVSSIGRILGNNSTITIWSRTAASANPATNAIFQNSTAVEFTAFHLTT